MKEGIEIQRILVASTAHITRDENASMNAACDGEEIDWTSCSCIESTSYGYMLFVSSEEPGWEKASLHLQKLVAMTYAADCSWLRLDRDGPVIPGLKTFEW